MIRQHYPDSFLLNTWAKFSDLKVELGDRVSYSLLLTALTPESLHGLGQVYNMTSASLWEMLANNFLPHGCI